MSKCRVSLAVCLLVLAAPAAQCAEGLFFDVLPTVINDRAMVPLRPIAEWLGATVTYRDGRIVATKGEGSTIRVELTLGSSKAKIADRDFVLGAPAQTIRGRVMVPLRFVAEGFGAWVDYQQRQITLTLAQENKKAVMTTPPHPQSHLGKMYRAMESYYGLQPAPEGGQSAGASGVKGIRVVKDHYDGGSGGWADVVVLRQGGKVVQQRVTLVKTSTGWRVSGAVTRR